MSKQSDLVQAIQEKKVLLVKVGEESGPRKVEPHILFRSLTMGGGMSLRAFELSNPNVLSSEPHWETFDVDRLHEVNFQGDLFTVRDDMEEGLELVEGSVEVRAVPDM